MSSHLRPAALAAALAMTAIAPHAFAQGVTVLGSTAYDVSANGVVVYAGGSSDYLWSSTTNVTTSIGGLAPGASGAAGLLAISADGSRVAGTVVSATTGEDVSGYYSTATGTWTALTGLGGSSGSNSMTTFGMSSDGRYIVGSSYTAVGNYSHAVITDTTTGVTTDVGPAGNTQSRINSVSTDGKVLFGYNTSSRYGSIWRDPEGDGTYTQTIVQQPGTTSNAYEGIALSNNGLWAAGSSFNTGLPYLVNVATGAVSSFAKLPFNDGSPSMKSTATPSAISDDGQTIIGTHSVGGSLDTNHGFIWTASGGVMDIDAYFAQYGIDTANAYNFISPLAMATQADGSVEFVGIALQNSTGAPVGFAVDVPSVVPEPASYALMLGGLAVIGVMKRRRSSKQVC